MHTIPDANTGMQAMEWFRRWARCVVILLYALPLVSGASAGAKEGIPVSQFEVGQIWRCTERDERAPETEELFFGVTGLMTERMTSDEPQFQNDNIVVNTALYDNSPSACRRVRWRAHLAFTERALKACAPVKVADDFGRISVRTQENAFIAKEAWIEERTLGDGVIIDLTPSHLFRVLRDRADCP